MLRTGDPAWTRLPAAPPPDPAAVLTRTWYDVDEHLTCYGHTVTWKERRTTGYRGTCSGCSGTITVALDGDLQPRVLTRDLASPGTGDYAECPTLTARRRPGRH